LLLFYQQSKQAKSSTENEDWESFYRQRREKGALIQESREVIDWRNGLSGGKRAHVRFLGTARVLQYFFQSYSAEMDAIFK
jgi:hypothetical protein